MVIRAILAQCETPIPFACRLCLAKAGRKWRRRNTSLGSTKLKEPSQCIGGKCTVSKACPIHGSGRTTACITISAFDLLHHLRCATRDRCCQCGNISLQRHAPRRPHRWLFKSSSLSVRACPGRISYEDEPMNYAAELLHNAGSTTAPTKDPSARPGIQRRADVPSKMWPSLLSMLRLNAREKAFSHIHEALQWSYEWASAVEGRRMFTFMAGSPLFCIIRSFWRLW